MRKRSSVSGDGRGEDEADGCAVRVSRSARLLKQGSSAVEVDFHAEVPVFLATQAHDAMHGINDIGLAKFGVEERIQAGLLGEIGLLADDVGSQALGGLGLDNVGQDKVE